MKVHQLINALSHLPSDATVEGDLVKAVDGAVYSLEHLVDEILDAQDDGRHVQIANAKAVPTAPAQAAAPATGAGAPGGASLGGGGGSLPAGGTAPS